MNKIIYISALCLLNTLLLGQASNFLTNDYVLPPPEASSFMKFIDQPVDYFSGTTSINIPIHTVQEGSLSVLISLSYHTGGVRVDEIAGWTGINWNLNIGGNLSRTIRGIADELDGSYKGYQISGNIMANGGTIEIYSEDIVNGFFDTEADIFSFNAGGYSGKFYFDKDGEVIMTKGESIKVEPSKEVHPYLWDKFIITTPDGNKYTFGTFDGRQAYEEQWTTDNINEEIILGDQKTILVLHLMAIENHSSDYKIEYFYSPESYKYPQKKTCTYKSGVLSNVCSTESISTTCYSGDTNNYFIQHIDGYKLDKIITQSEEVNFYSTRDREDLEFPFQGSPQDGADYLHSISINNNVKKNVNFYYSYFTDGNSSLSYHKRLKLDSIIESSGSLELPPYKFEYHSDFLPNRFSKSLDHWGFYNGAPNNTQYNIPETTISTQSGEETFGDANRKADSLYVNTGMLNKITYPTGGFRSFIYENHSTYANSETSQLEFFIRDCGEDLPAEGESICNADPDLDNNLEYTFKEGEINSGYIEVGVTHFYAGLPGDIPDPSTVTLLGILKFTPPSGASIIEITFLDVIDASQTSNITKKYKLSDLGLQEGISYNVSIELETDVPGDEESGWAQAKFYSFPLEEVLVGGSRIKKIITNDGYDTFERSYEYQSKDSPTSGILYQKPVYGHNYSGSYMGLGWSVNTWSDAVLFPYNSYSGSYIGYNQVIEKTQNNGIIKRQYYALQNQFLEWPIIPTQPKALNGKLKSTEMINTTGLGVALATNEYGGASLLEEEDDLWDMYAIEKLGPFPDCNSSTFLFFPLNTGYNPIQIKNVLKKEISIRDNVKTSTSYKYDLESDHLFPISVTTCDDDNNCYKQNSKYLDDYTINSAVQEYFNDNNMLLPAWTTKKTKGEGVNLIEISGSRTRWSFFGGNCYPYLFQSLNEDGTWKEMASISEYNADGFPTTVHRRQKAKHINLTWKTGNQFGLIDNIQEYERVFQYGYEGGRKLRSILDNNSIESTFSYDLFKRLDLSSSNNGRISQDIDYIYGLANGSENKITTTQSYTDGTESQEIHKIFDGLGRYREERRLAYTQSGTDYVLAQSYNELGNVVSSTDPGIGGTTTFEYEKSPLNRVLIKHPAGSEQPISNAYTSNSLVIGGYSSNTLFKTSTTDENGNISVSYLDVFGRQIATVIDEGGENLMTVYEYNDRDQITSIQPPAGAPYEYTYYPDGLLWTKTVPDKGITTYVYNEYDQIWKESLPNGKELEYNYHSDYNSFLETVKLDGQVIKSYEPDDPTLVQEWVKKESQAVHFSEGIIPDGHVTEYLDYDYDFGRPKLVETTTVGGTSSTVLNYDNPGNLILSETTIKGPDGINKLMINEPTYHKGLRQVSNPFEVDGLIIGVDDLKYNNNDWLTQKTLHKNIQTIDFQYNGRGWLKNINGVSDTYTNGDPCNTDPPPTDFVDCDKLINIVQTFIILYDCQSITNNTPTSLKIKKSTQYFEGGNIANAAMSNEFDIPISGGINSSNIILPDSISFTLNGSISDQDFNIALLELLIDCINNNPQILDDINNALLDITESFGSIGGESGGGNNENSSNSNDDVFGMEIHYVDGNSELSALPQYNGNISWMEWRIKSDQRHAYGFNYDGANRLLDAFYGEDDPATKECKIEKTNKYSIKIPEYDNLGNIMSIIRIGLKDPLAEIPEYGLIDMMDYNYIENSSLLSSVDESSSWLRGFQGEGSTYSYTTTGNLKSDSEKGIVDIIYSHNDLPLKIKTNEGDIFNWYTSDGLKVKSHVVPSANSPTSEVNEVTHYINSAEYKNDELEAIYVDEGRIVFPKSENAYIEYYLKDHLGNTRARIADKNGDNLVNIDPNNPEKDELMNIRHYYPFGMEWDTPLVGVNGGSLDESGVKNRYTYNGKEFVDDLDINLYDYGARYYDPAIARWTTIDPLAEEMSNWSPYNFGFANPIRFFDPTGLAPTDAGGHPGKVIAVFYHGGPSGGGKTTTASNAGGAGEIYNSTASSAMSSGRGFAGRIIAPGVTSSSGVKNGLNFVKDNYNQGDQVIVYGYSYGGDVSTELAAALGEAGIPVDLLVTVDATDGPLQNSTVDTEVSENVDTNLNIYQTNDSGSSSSSRSTGATSSGSSSGSSSSNSGTSNSPGSNGGPNSAVNKNKTHIINLNVSGSGLTHGNIQSKLMSTINHAINNHIQQ